METKLYAKKITLFLLDGSSNGRIACELSNWNGKAYKIPRSLLKHCGDRPDLSGTGIYMLFGRDSEKSEIDVVYIGESEEVFRRLMKHYGEKEFWNEAVVITSKDSNLNKAHIKFLERKLYEKAMVAGRYKIANGNKPPSSSISEADIAEMEEFFKNIQILTNVLGYKVFEKTKLAEPLFISSADPIFYITAAHGAKAQGQITSEGFVILANSKIANAITPSYPQVSITMRDRLIAENIISSKANELSFSKDYLFSSPSAAAQIVLGRSANGLQEWKTIDNTTLKQFENQQ